MQSRSILAVAVLGIGLGATSPASADSVDIALSSDAIGVAYGTNLRSAELVFGGLVNRDTHDKYASVGLLAHGEGSGNERIEVGVGGKLYGVSSDDQDLFALGLGGKVRWFPANGPIAIGAYAFLAPRVVTAGDGKQFWDAGVHVDWEVVKRTATVFVGYRKVRAEFDNDRKVDIDKGAMAGVTLFF
jgi:hypothetical protein